MKGILLGLTAAVLYAAIMLLNKKMGAIDPYDKTVIQLGVSAVVSVPCRLSCLFQQLDMLLAKKCPSR